MNFTVGRLWLRYFLKVYLLTRFLIASQFMVSYTANAKFFSYTRKDSDSDSNPEDSDSELVDLTTSLEIAVVPSVM